MGRSSRLTLFLMCLAVAPTSAGAQFYGFPSEVGVLDDGFGVLPPSLPPFPSAPPRGVPIDEEAGAPFPPLPPQARPPACPLVIKIGRGLRHPVETRIVYGRPACS